MEIRHSLQILDLLKFESPLLDYQLNSNNCIKYYVGNGDSTLTTNP